MPRTSTAFAAVLLTTSFAGAAQAKTYCCGAKLAMTFGDAGLEVKLLALILWIAAIAAVVAWPLALRSIQRGQQPDRALAFLRGCRAAAPLLALGGAAYIMMNFFVAVYAYPPVASYRDYAPGLAEVAMVLWAGFQAGGIAALAAAHVGARVATG